jgi:hypothetical protein
MAVHGGTWHYFLLSITVYGSTWRYKTGFAPQGGAVPPADFRALLKLEALHCLHYSWHWWQQAQFIASTNSSIHALFLLALARPPPPARLCHPRPASSPPPPRVQPRQQPRLPRALEFPTAAAAAGSAVAACAEGSAAAAAAAAVAAAAAAAEAAAW